MNWFSRHLNWTTGIFGHLLVFVLVLLYFAPSGAWGRFLIDMLTGRIAIFRTPEYAFYHEVFTATYFMLALVLYLGVNIWYLRIKRLSYEYLWWLSPPLILLGTSSIFKILDIANVGNLILPTYVQWALFIIFILLQPLWFALAAFMLLRLKNNDERA
jgi:hypothetical protein